MICFKLINRLALFVALLLTAMPAAAQLKCSLNHYTTEDGLSHDRVLCMTKDREGFMWFGTWDGINRFDGHNFKAYKAHPGDSSNLKNNKIRAIIEDKLGYLWVKTYDNEVYRFDKRTEKFLSIHAPGEHNASQNPIEKIVPLSNGDTWLITNKHGLLCCYGSRSLSAPKVELYGKGLPGNFSIGSNTVNFLYEDAHRQLWVGTSAGLYSFVKQNGTYVKVGLSKSVSGNGISSTCVTEKNEVLYFGTAQGNLVIYNEQLRTFDIKQITKNAPINAVCVAKTGSLYVSTSGNGLAIVNPQTYAVQLTGLSKTDTYYSIFEDKTGLLWIEPEKTGVVKYNPVLKTFKLFTQKTDTGVTGKHTLYNVFYGANNIIWVTMRGGGFGYYNPVKDSFEYFYDEPGSVTQRFSNIVTSDYTDETGILWVSGYEGGIFRAIFQSDNFNHHLLVSNPKNNTENEVRAIFEDSSHKLWIGAKSGHLHVFKDGEEITDPFINLPPGGMGNVYTITQGKNGHLWFGTKANGLFEATPIAGNSSKYALVQYLHDIHNPNSLSGNSVYSVLEDKKGRLWVGIFGGGINLLIKDGDKTLFENHNNSFKNYPFTACNVVRHLQQDAGGNIWVATTNGLVVFNPDAGNPDSYMFYHYTKIPGDPGSLGNNDVQYINRDRTGQMWLGTFGGGLYKLVSGSSLQKLKFKFYTTLDGLPNDIILSIVDDNDGNLWLATENGLCKYNPASNIFQNYDYYDGLPDTRFSEAACLNSSSGELFLGCLNGYVSFYPRKVYNTRFNSTMALTDIQLSNKSVTPGAKGAVLQYPVDETSHITLKHDQNLVSIDYTVLDYRESHKILYAYKLDGIDKDWNYVKTQRQATYSNLSPGTYTFTVKSVSYDLFKNVPQKCITITILPPPWLTAWAYLGYAVLVIIAIYIARRIILTMIRLRNRVVVEQKLTELKLSFFTNISHELKTPLTLIVSPLAEIGKEKLSPQGREYISVVNKNANRMIRFINQLLDFRKVQSGKMRLKISQVEVVQMVKQIGQYYTEAAHEKNIKLLVTSNIPALHAWIDEEKVDIVIYNLLSNAFKFTPPNKVIKIDVNYHGGSDFFTIDVIDEGVGVPKHKLNEIFELYYEGDKAQGSNLKGTGVGLALSKEFVLSHHGDITATNNLAGGMTFSVKLLMGHEHFTEKEADFVTESNPSEFIQSAYIDLPEVESVLPENADTHLPTVLIVEDNTDLRRFLTNQLAAHYNTKDAANGADGFQIATDLLPDLIISDVMMPVMDGIQMLDKLKHSITTSHIPIILLSAKASIENQIEGLKYGADLYITKPFQTDLLLASVNNLIKQRKQLFENLTSNKKHFDVSPSEIVITSKDEQLLKETIKIVEANMPDTEFNIDSVAVSVGLGRTTFYKKIKSLTGFAPVEFVREMRLKRAVQLLDSGEYTISEVAYMIGFSSLGYFGTCFKEKYHVSPSQYLKEEKHTRPV